MYKKIFLLFLTFLIVGDYVSAQTSILSDSQSEWLANKQFTIIARPEKKNAPFSFVTSAGRTPQGIGIDYLQLIAKKIGATIQYTEPKTRNALLEDIREGKEGVLVSIGYSEKNESYLYFSDPYVFIPSVIVVRKDNPNQRRYRTLSDLEGVRIAVVEEHSIEHYIKENYKKIILDSVMDNEVALQKVLLGEVEGAVVDIASLAYYTKNNALSYLTTVGQTGYDVEISFGIPKTHPELQAILNAGLMNITPEEKEVIQNSWLNYSSETFNSSGKNNPQITILVISSVSIFILGILFLVLSFFHTRKEKHILGRTLISAEELKKQLYEIEEANALVAKEIQEIKEFEARLENKK